MKVSEARDEEIAARGEVGRTGKATHRPSTCLVVPSDMTRDRILLTAAWLMSAWIFLRYWDLTVRAEALLVWSAIFTGLFMASAFVGKWRGLASMESVLSATGLWACLAVLGSCVGLFFPVVPLGSSDVQSVAFLRVFDLIVPLWILLHGVHHLWEGRLAVAVTSAVPLALLVMIWWLTVRMPGQSHVGPVPPLTVAEAELAERLEAHVVTLADSIGARGWRQPEAVVRTIEYLRGELRSMGYSPSELPYEVSGRTELNLEVTFSDEQRQALWTDLGVISN